MKHTFKYRLYPNKEQERKLHKTLFLCRKLYNAGLEQRILAYKNNKKGISCYRQINQILEIKQAFSEYKEVHSQILQDALRRLYKSYSNFFRRVKNGEYPGFPRFKSRNRFKSFTYPQSGFKLKDGRLYLSKIGNIRIFQHRPIDGDIKTLTIKRDNVGDWFATFVVESPDTPKIEPKTLIGVDVGIEKFATLSNGEMITNPHILLESERRLRIVQKGLSRKKKGSNNRKKSRIRVAKTHRKIQRQRDDFLHKASKALVSKSDLIAFENLRIKNMIKNKHLSKSISDCSWGKLMQYTTYKAEEAGKYVYFVSPNGTSQICSKCGVIVKKSLSVRIHQCPTCGLRLDRDLNASLNILKRVGWGTPKPNQTPTEIGVQPSAQPVEEVGSPRHL